MNQEQEYEFTEQNCLDDFIEAKLRLITKPHNAFIGSLLYDLSFEPTHSVDTVALDSLEQKLYVNPEYFCRLTHEQQATVLAHEVYHYALMHDVRRGMRDKALYQKASDEVVNNLLASSGFEIPPDVEYDTKYKNMSTEYVYNFMEQERQQKQNQNNNNNNNNNNQNQQNNGPLGNDLFNNGSNMTQVQQNTIQQHIMKANTAEELASGIGMQAGNSGSIFETLFKEITEGKLSWIEILQEYLNEFQQGGIDYTRYNRRYLPMDLYLPDNRTEEQIEKVALAFDVSGSVSEEQIKAFLHEMKAIKSQLNPKTMDVVTFNHKIVDIFTISESDNFDEVTMKISGGTDLHPVFNHYLKPENKPEFLIVFSDLECEPIEEPTPFNTIWICIDNNRAEVNFGKLFHIKSEDLI